MEVISHPNPALKQRAEEVDPTTDAGLKDLCKQMARVMYDAPGIGLAATQVNVHERVIVIDISETHDELRAFINPEIVAQSGRAEGEEGCLSVPDYTGNVIRAERIQLQALDREGNPLSFDMATSH